MVPRTTCILCRGSGWVNPPYDYEGQCYSDSVEVPCMACQGPYSLGKGTNHQAVLAAIKAIKKYPRSKTL